ERRATGASGNPTGGRGSTQATDDSATDDPATGDHPSVGRQATYPGAGRSERRATGASGNPTGGRGSTQATDDSATDDPATDDPATGDHPSAGRQATHPGGE
ncbi:hypothetical protein, partial [Nonomuraea sp. NPDC049309]|uniref:hypothetical protein n=1 Tax=Nonomuraea sp. NPDC049309 TaxID=3364350 RepID=UPI0037149464